MSPAAKANQGAQSSVQVVPWPLHLLLLTQLLAATWIVHHFRIEGTPLFHVMLLATGGFALNLWFPALRNQIFFVALSLAAALVVFGWVDGLWLIGCGLLLIGCCHLPLRMGSRVTILLVLGVVLAMGRGGVIPSSWSPAVWPILGSMFMFRLVLYMRALSVGQVERNLSSTLAYFFMLPNLVFPLFPVVDYQTFRKTYFDRPAAEIYEQGMLWISRGLVHLLLYRFVYQYVVSDPTEVERLSDLVQYMLGTFLLYLRVSGQFHLIVGLLHLFGFRLPETHHLYYLSHNFTELWRRINIYWKDFMLQVVFYPAYFRLKRLGPTAAIAWSTAAVFAATWILHSYQWFWLRGGFPLTLPDVLFWGILGGLVVLGALRESKQPAKSRRRSAGWDLRHGLRAAATFCAFCFLWSLWSTETVGEWLWLLGAAGQVDLKGLLVIICIFGSLVLLGGTNWEAAPVNRPSWIIALASRRARTIGSLLLLIVASQPLLQSAAPSTIAGVLESLQNNRLNTRDAALQHRGYYEQLEIRDRVGDADAVFATKPTDWQDVGSIGVIRETHDGLTRDLFPSRHIVWNGNLFTTNRWGMRDQDYTLEKESGTLRIALLGPSHVMGNGVSDGETFESLLEARFNRELKLPGINKIEILNFGVDGYCLTQQVALLEDRALSFHPDLVIATHYHQNRNMTGRYLQKLVTRGIAAPDEQVGRLLESAGLNDINRGTVPVPFALGRNLARKLGLDPRMPSSELSARLRRISGETLSISFERFARVTRDNGAIPLVLALDDVLDGVGTEVPDGEGITKADLPVINLLGVYPESRRGELRLGSWDNHPNAEGHRLIAERLYMELSTYLLSLPTSSGGDARASNTN